MTPDELIARARHLWLDNTTDLISYDTTKALISDLVDAVDDLAAQVEELDFERDYWKKKAEGFALGEILDAWREVAT